MFAQLTAWKVKRLVFKRCQHGIGSHSLSSLDVLFFGSDEFSIHALDSLRSLQNNYPPLVKDIQVVTRKPKWCGRYKSVLKHTPIVEHCKTIGLREPLLCDSKQDMLDIGDVHNYDMVVAVSFGKLIPSKLLSKAKYSLNIHPSLLPRYKGASPIQYALLNRDTETGVTIQTLHPNKFDHGRIIAQTRPLSTSDLLAKGVVSEFPEKTPIYTAILMDQLGLVGGELLKKVISEQLYTDQNKSIESGQVFEASYASRITSAMKQISWNTDEAIDLVVRLNTLGPLFAPIKVLMRKNGNVNKRIIFHDFTVCSNYQEKLGSPGQFCYDDKSMTVVVCCANNSYIQVKSLQFEGFTVETASEFVRRFRKRCGNKTESTFEFV
ncbi:hypothetical protein TPHA_0F00590 [Tetrapisispora phaffii CBS 4417]|uniref:Methionyl-tRNA formyltransferase, mitochondrial n=1 Tax=Tetrapisispora phaffii (strain ATCC 24235 / CBS 4417 / NBRC 1672 / NRRL Y-8282 / UCD 70-5) TaxID=1071381 RepID=G8BUW4_TETPH|nr:hypothetical protein TPHA_0F00590 [Tetrapisispora phaffii CBS 4417]CCE63546.1 hypothetical protein TPHA_0F00590 [Tetrapisispora phaffii CBS 4417]